MDKTTSLAADAARAARWAARAERAAKYATAYAAKEKEND